MALIDAVTDRKEWTKTDRKEFVTKFKELSAREDAANLRVSAALAKRSAQMQEPTEQQFQEAIAAVLRRFPKLNVVRFTPEDMGRGLARIQWKAGQLLSTMHRFDCSMPEAIATLDEHKIWHDEDS
jgi:hypothetical protein